MHYRKGIKINLTWSEGELNRTKMYTLLTYETGRRTEALVMSATQDRLRVIVPNRNETLELRLQNGVWVAENGERVEIDAIISDARDARPAERVMTAATQ